MLLDGGKSVLAIANLFNTHIGTRGVNILVCTHNDADHTNGMLGFLKAGLLAEELWLPGRWLESLPQVLQPLHAITEQLAGAVESKELKSNGQTAGENPLERLILDESDTDDHQREYSNLGDDGWPEKLLTKLEHCSVDDWHSSELFVYPFHYHFWHIFWRQKDQARREILFAAIDAAKRIREIAIAAFHRGIKVRWFQHCPESPCGGSERLQAINAREIKRYSVASDDMALLNFLALSVSNKESLVFYAPGEENEGAVLFTADSDLSDINLNRALKNALVTSPHHGSDANNVAYGMVNAAAGDDAATLTWVRSDGRFRSRPGKEYLRTQQARYCTICRKSPTNFDDKKSVELDYTASSWRPSCQTNPCKCT